MDTRLYSKEFITDFINLYKSCPCLWKSKDYSDRNKKTAAYELLIHKFKEVEPSPDREMVTKKINNLRSSFRKELKKVLASKRSGAGCEDIYIYIPSLWYFDLLSFLTDQEIPRDSKSSIDFGEEENKKEQETFAMNESESLLSSTHSDDCFVTFSRTSSTVQKRQKRKKEDSSELLLRTVNEKLQNMQQEDDCDVIGKNVAIKLRNLPKEQKNMAEKLINDVLFEAQLGNLDRNSQVTIHREGGNQQQILNITPLQNYIYDFNNGILKE